MNVIKCDYCGEQIFNKENTEFITKLCINIK